MYPPETRNARKWMKSKKARGDEGRDTERCVMRTVKFEVKVKGGAQSGARAAMRLVKCPAGRASRCTPQHWCCLSLFRGTTRGTLIAAVEYTVSHRSWIVETVDSRPSTHLRSKVKVQRVLRYFHDIHLPPHPGVHTTSRTLALNLARDRVSYA